MALILRCKLPSFCRFCNCKVILKKFHIVNREIVNPHRFQIFFMDMNKMDNTAKHDTTNEKSNTQNPVRYLCSFYENINRNMTLMFKHC